MSKVFSKRPNRKAIVLSGFHTSFEDSINGLGLIDFKNKLTLKNDPLSSLHVLLIDIKNPQRKFRIEKADIAIADQDRHALYHLLAIALNYFDQN